MPGHHPLFYVYITDGSLWALSVDQLDAYGDEDDEGGVQETLFVPSYWPFLWNIVELIVHSSFMFPVQVSKAAGTSSAGDCGKSRADSFEVNSAA